MRKLLVVALLIGAGCAHEPELQPVPAANVAVRNDVASQTVAGVRVEAVGKWNGDPPDLGRVLAPVGVTIENHSGRPLRVRYEDFSLVGQRGFRYAALPPFGMRAAVGTRDETPRFRLAAAYAPARAMVRPIAHPRFFHRGFYVAPQFGWIYPGFAPWPYGPWAYDPLYYDRWYGYWPQPLPSQDMLEQALPEGAVADGGNVSGYVYFQTPETNQGRVNFELKLVDANTGQQFGMVSIPFVAQQ
jgi:hypothetical protein